MDNSESTFPLFNIGVVTRVTGVPSATLHAWERRYGFPLAARTAGGHRLYSERDIARLRWVKSQIDMGLTVSRAVIAVRALEADGRLILPIEQGYSVIPGRSGEKLEPSIKSSPSLLDSLLETFIANDLPRADQLIGEMLAFYTPEYLTLNVIGPALNSIGEDWEQNRITIATEHLASNYLRHRLLMWMVTGPSARPGNPIVLACAPGEWHEGSLLMLGVLLRRQGWPVAYLGQNVPLFALAKFNEATIPQAVVLVAMGGESARALADWPNWIKQLSGHPLITFGGRAFVVEPELKTLIPGIFLGNTIPEGISNLISRIQSGGN
jgi:DNA-binding transcriptional MerR regulator